MESRKQDFIIEIGAEWVRVGLISDRTPRKTIPAQQLGKFRSDIPQNEYEIQIQEILYSVFYTYINSSVAGRTVIILQKVFTDRRIVETMAKILFKKYKIQRLEFSLSCITPLYLSCRFSGVVVSGGASSLEIMPVFQSYPLTQQFKYIPSGTQAMNKVIKDELLLLNPEAGAQVFQKITEEYLNDLKNSYSNMNLVQAKSEDVVNLTIKKNKIKFKPASINYSNIFGNPQKQEYNAAYMFLQALNKVEIKILDSIASNVILAGGLWRVKGMQKYFKKQIKQFLPQFKRLQNLKLAEKLKFVSWSFNPSQVSWIGCSVGASVRAIQSLCLKKSEYENEGFTEKIMSSYFLSY